MDNSSLPPCEFRISNSMSGEQADALRNAKEELYRATAGGIRIKGPAF